MCYLSLSLRFFFILVMFSSLLYSLDFKETVLIKLKKDEQKKFLVKYENFEKLLSSDGHCIKMADL